MRRALSLAVLLLPLIGCDVQPGGDGYDPNYAEQTDVYPGYAYNSGSPYMSYEGATVPLIFFGGYWGFYDGYHRFHRAPDAFGRHLQSRHPQGSGVRSFSGRPVAPAYSGGNQQAAPRPQYRQNTVAPDYTAPPVPTAQPPARTAPAAVHVPPPPVVRTVAPAAPTPKREEHRDHRCPNGQTHC